MGTQREMNELADYFSRVVDHDDWYIDHTVFAMVDEWWGPHTIDRFAASYNKQVERFNSRYACPATEAVDSFTVNWSGESNWLCPPPSLIIPRVIRHAECCKAQGTLVVPWWESAPFWPLLCPTGGEWASFGVDYGTLPLSEELIRPGRTGSALFGGKFPNTAVIALRVDFEYSSQKGEPIS